MPTPISGKPPGPVERCGPCCALSGLLFTCLGALIKPVAAGSKGCPRLHHGLRLNLGPQRDQTVGQRR